MSTLDPILWLDVSFCKILLDILEPKDHTASIYFLYMQLVIFLNCIVSFLYFSIYFTKIINLFYLPQLNFIPKNVTNLVSGNNSAGKRFLVY